MIQHEPLVALDPMYAFVMYHRKPKSPNLDGRRVRVDTFIKISVCRNCGVEIDRYHEYCSICYRDEVTK